MVTTMTSITLDELAARADAIYARYTSATVTLADELGKEIERLCEGLADLSPNTQKAALQILAIREKQMEQEIMKAVEE